MIIIDCADAYYKYFYRLCTSYNNKQDVHIQKIFVWQKNYRSSAFFQVIDIQEIPHSSCIYFSLSNKICFKTWYDDVRIIDGGLYLCQQWSGFYYKRRVNIKYSSV